MTRVRAHVRLVAALWLLAQAVCMARPLWVAGDGLARLMATPKCADATSAGRLCPMRRPDGTSCPMHRVTQGQTACTMTAACGRTDEFLTATTTPLATPLEASSFPVAFTSTRDLTIAEGVPHNRSTPPESPPPRA